MSGVPLKSFLSESTFGPLVEGNRRGVLEDLGELANELVSMGGGEPRAAEYTGLKALMLAVLEDGIVSFVAREGSERAEAETWIMGQSQRSPFSFPVVCETLGLEPSAVRIALRRMQSRHLAGRRPIVRARPNVRRARRSACAGGERSS